ncbi:MAG: MBL fold metallo-hydrolase [Gemmatimonadales bacterium]
MPQIGCDCAVCRSTDPRDRRSRSGAVLETGGRTLLIDTPPELRLQLLAMRLSMVDAVLYTHDHADHTAGIDDLRIFSVRQKRAIPLYGPAEALEHLRSRYRYIFDDAVRPPEGTSKPRLSLYPLEAGVTATVADVPVTPLAFPHGDLRVFGYRFGALAYLTDVKQVDAAAVERLRGVQTLIINALWWRSHPTHLSIDEAIAVARAVGAERTYLTHLTHETGHAELLGRLPAGIEPAFDGLTVELP